SAGCRFTTTVNRHPADLCALSANVRVLGDGSGGAPVRLGIEWPAPSVVAAVAAGISRLESLGLRVLRVESGDWVTQREIAARAGRSRETVRLWSTGRLGPGGFPPPVNPGAVTSFYSWAEVLRWLRDWRGAQVPEAEAGLAAANLVLQLRSLAPSVPDMAEIWRLLARSALTPAGSGTAG
ncbi:MAG TPA: hypothetical protein VNV66_11535, partial [Pilimelia sp.]|nr:hypothetical protein [Pilimelia sp.]